MDTRKENERRGLAVSGFLWSLVYHLGSQHEIQMSLVKQILERSSGEWLFTGPKGVITLQKRKGAYSLVAPEGTASSKEEREFQRVVKALRTQLQAILGPDEITPAGERRRKLLPDPTRVTEYRLYAHALSSATAA